MTTGSPSDQTTPAAKTKSGGMGQAILFVILLFIGFLFGGYYLGTQAQFSTMANPKAAGGFPGMSLFTGAGNVKKWYWLHSKGWNRAGYVTTVLVNGELVGKFFKPDVDVDITSHVRPGRNKISFSAKSLPMDQRDDSTSTYLTIELKSGDRKPNQENKFEGGDVLLDYTRKVTDTEDFNDVNEFETIE